MGKPPKNITAVVADEHGEIREVVCEYLNSLPGVRVVAEAIDGFQAITETDRLRPDFVYLDVGLPRLSGIQAARIIKHRHALTKVFLATLYDESLYEREAKRASADGLISKTHLKQSLAVLVRVMQSHIGS